MLAPGKWDQTIYHCTHPLPPMANQGSDQPEHPIRRRSQLGPACGEGSRPSKFVPLAPLPSSAPSALSPPSVDGVPCAADEDGCPVAGGGVGVAPGVLWLGVGVAEGRGVGVVREGLGREGEDVPEVRVGVAAAAEEAEAPSSAEPSGRVPFGSAPPPACPEPPLTTFPPTDPASPERSPADLDGFVGADSGESLPTLTHPAPAPRATTTAARRTDTYNWRTGGHLRGAGTGCPTQLPLTARGHAAHTAPEPRSFGGARPARRSSAVTEHGQPRPGLFPALNYGALTGS